MNPFFSSSSSSSVASSLLSISRVATLALVATGVVIACSSDEDSGAAAEAAAQDSFLNDYCEIVNECCNQILAQPKDVPTCKKRIGDLDPAMIKDAKARTTCLSQLRAVAAKTDFCSEFGNHDQGACPDVSRKTLTGAKKPGDACAADAECAPSFDGPVACKGVCQVTKRGKEGDGPCVMTVDRDIAVKAKDDAQGNTAVVCYLAQDSLLCDPASKKCAKPLAVDGACTDSFQCVRTAFCDPASKKCTTKKANGNSCDAALDQCQGHCEGGFCKANAKEGEACKDATFCVSGEGLPQLDCIGGKCAKPPAADARLAASCGK